MNEKGEVTTNTIETGRKERILNICCNVDGTGGDSAELNKSSRERQLSYDFSHLWIIGTRMIGRGRMGLGCVRRGE